MKKNQLAEIFAQSFTAAFLELLKLGDLRLHAIMEIFKFDLI